MSPLPVTGLSQLRDTEDGVLDVACRFGAGPGTWTGERNEAEEQPLENHPPCLFLEPSPVFGLGNGDRVRVTPDPFLGILLNLDDRNSIKQCPLIAAKHTFLATKDTFPSCGSELRPGEGSKAAAPSRPICPLWTGLPAMLTFFHFLLYSAW